jgi:tRNA threonylcarbamoyladenosine biosynthesis protein TsaB
VIRILAADTSTSISTIAVCEGEADATPNTHVLSEMVVECRRLHAERLIASIDWLLNEAGLTLNDINALAISIGPGSFTGLRIGAATWKGLALARDLPLVAVPTLDALTRNAYFLDATVCAVLDARMKEVFGAIYRFSNSLREKCTPDCVGPVEKLLEGVAGPVHFIGDGAVEYRDRILACLPNARFVPRMLAMPRASAVAEEGLSLLAAGIPTNPDLVDPVYLRLSQPEMLRAQRAQKTATE